MINAKWYDECSQSVYKQDSASTVVWRAVCDVRLYQSITFKDGVLLHFRLKSTYVSPNKRVVSHTGTEYYAVHHVYCILILYFKMFTVLKS